MVEAQEPQQQNPLGTNVGYMPHQLRDVDPMMSKHLDVSDILVRLKNTLMGLEYNDEEDSWQPVTSIIGYDKKHKPVYEEEGK